MKQLLTLLWKKQLNYALEVDAVLAQGLDAPEPLDVAVGVASAPPGGAGGADEPEAVVLAQRLRVHARQLGGHRDDVECSRTPTY